MPLFELKKRLALQIADHLKIAEISPAWVEHELVTPPTFQLGHISLPCYKLSKTIKAPSDKIAKELCEHLSKNGMTAVSAGPYANFKWNLASLYDETLATIFSHGGQYGSDKSGENKRIVLEYCSPNIAKKLAFQHIRSTLIGNTLANIYDFLGYRTDRVNFIGDWGTQFGRLLAGFEQWGDKKKIQKSHVRGSMEHLFETYVRYHKEVESRPELLENASKCLKRLEEGHEPSLELWASIRDISLASMDSTLKRMNIRFNHVEGESTYIKEMPKTLEHVKEKASAHLSEGAWIVDVEGINTPALIQKRDGTTLYLTRDIAAAIDRYERFPFDRMYYVVSEQQRLHFQLLFGVLKKMGYRWAERCAHLSFGTVLFGSEKMSTREGRVIFLDDLLNEAKALALNECTKKNPNLANKEQVAEQVGIGAIIFGELSSHRQRDIEFDWEKILSFDGETGPYVQYSLVRCYSLLTKAEKKGQEESTVKGESYDFSPEEEVLVLCLARFRSVLHLALRDNEPYLLTHYLIDVAKAFNRFYYQLPVLQATDLKQRQLRLSLVRGTCQTLENGLRLLGIESPKEM